VLRYLNYQI